MNEVSGRFAKWVYESGISDDVPEPVLLEGVDIEVEILKGGRQRISWDAYIRMLENYYDSAGFERMRGTALEFGTTNELAFFSKIAGLFLSPKNLYRFMYRWAGNHFLRNVNFDFSTAPDGTYRIVSRIDPATQDSPVFFKTLTNVLAGAPCRIGRPPAEVEILEVEPHRAEYRIVAPRSASIGWYLKWPLRAIKSIPAFGSLFARQQLEIKESHSAIVRQREDFQRMVEKISDCVFVVAPEGEAIFANASARAAFGLGENGERRWDPASLLETDQTSPWREFLEAAENIGREFVFKGAGGRETTLAFGPPSPTLFGETEALMLVGRDVTQAREVEARLREVALEERRRIAGDLHDGLGQVLTGINWQANLLATQLEGDGKGTAADAARKIAGLATESTHQARDLAHGLAGIDERADNLKRALIDHANKVEREFDLSVDLSLPDSELSAPGQAALEILRIVQEATHNAVKHAETRELLIAVDASGDRWTVTVADRGNGLPGGESISTGMGVRSMRYRASALGGEISLTPREGGGAELRLVVPGQELQASPEIRTKPARRETDLAPREGTLRVAVADDHETVREGIVALLGAEKGVEICAQIGERDDIVPLVSEAKPDVLVTDMLMDGDDNLETIARLRDALPNLRIVVLSMFHEEQYGDAARRAGADAYVMKQAPPAELVAQVRAV